MGVCDRELRVTIGIQIILKNPLQNSIGGNIEVLSSIAKFPFCKIRKPFFGPLHHNQVSKVVVFHPAAEMSASLFVDFFNVPSLTFVIVMHIITYAI